MLHALTDLAMDSSPPLGCVRRAQLSQLVACGWNIGFFCDGDGGLLLVWHNENDNRS